jgi:prepilin-type N-terminal cleavage/methylation domain-containing protein
MVKNGFHRLSRDTRGFTMIELLLVVAILGVLATIAIRAMSDERRRSYDAQTITFMRNLLTAVETDPPTHFGLISGQQPLQDYPQLQLNPGMSLLVQDSNSVDGENKYQFFLAHQAGRAGFYFWVPGPDCPVETDDVTVLDQKLNHLSIPSDKIVPELATVGEIYYTPFRNKVGFP